MSYVVKWKSRYYLKSEKPDWTRAPDKTARFLTKGHATTVLRRLEGMNYLSIVRRRRPSEKRREAYEAACALRAREEKLQDSARAEERKHIVAWFAAWLRLNVLILDRHLHRDFPARVAFTRGMVCVLQQAVDRIQSRDLRTEWSTELTK